MLLLRVWLAVAWFPYV